MPEFGENSIDSARRSHGGVAAGFFAAILIRRRSDLARLGLGSAGHFSGGLAWLGRAR